MKKQNLLGDKDTTNTWKNQVKLQNTLLPTREKGNRDWGFLFVCGGGNLGHLFKVNYLETERQSLQLWAKKTNVPASASQNVAS